MPNSDPILYKMLQNDVCELTLNRPHKINTLNHELIIKLSEYLQKISSQSTIRVVIIKATGKWFCGGADLNWMLEAGQYEQEKNYLEALDLANLYHQLNTLPAFTIAKVAGGAMGGGIGLLCCCDMVIATEDCDFSFGELKLGLLPATIIPYVLATLGERQARRYVLNSEHFTSETARKIGLIHEIIKYDQMEQEVQRLVKLIQSISPEILRQCKSLIQQYCHSDKKYIADSAQLLAQSRSSIAAQRGMQAFFDKLSMRL